MYLENYEMNGQNITGCHNMVTHAVSNVSQQICESYMWAPVDGHDRISNDNPLFIGRSARCSKSDRYTSAERTITPSSLQQMRHLLLQVSIGSMTHQKKSQYYDILLYHVLAGTVIVH